MSRRLAMIGVLASVAACALAAPRYGCDAPPPLDRPAFELETDVALPRCTGSVLLDVRSCGGEPVTPEFLGVLELELRARLRRRGVKLLGAHVLQAWQEEHPNWNTPRETGLGCGAEWVVKVDAECGNTSVEVWDVLTQDKARRLYKVQIKTTDPGQTAEELYRLLCPH